MSRRNRDRARGALWGQAVGDACGTTQEFTRGSDPKPFPAMNTSPQEGIVGGGPFGLEPGQVTDDTQMAVCLAESLADLGLFDPEDAARRYVEWSNWAFDIGNQTRAALAKAEGGAGAVEAGYLIWEGARRAPAGNGSLMRVSPVPVFFAEDPAGRRRAALDDSAVTHADPRCRLACAAFSAAVAHALVDPSATAESMLREAERELGPAAAAIDDRTPADLRDAAVEALRRDLESASRNEPDLESDEVHFYRHAGFVRVAFRVAFWELLHAPDFPSAVLDCTNRGGDADTNAAIAGALYGALVGEKGVPQDWRDLVQNACSAPKFARTPWAERYHPRKLFRVLK